MRQDQSPLRLWYILRVEELSAEMTTMEVSYRFTNRPSESVLRAIDNVREVYGIRKVRVNEKEQLVRVEYDASRFKEPVVVNLLRRAGLDVRDRLESE